jgi:hypothetical protein
MPSIQEILGKTKFNKNDLLDKCRELGIRGYSGLKKQELILKIEIFVNDSPSETDIELTSEEQEIDYIIDELLVSEELPEEQPPEQKPKTRDAETQVKTDDFIKKEDNASIHYQVIDKVNLQKTKKLKEFILKTINSNSKYKLGDIILNEKGIIKLDKKEYITNDCLNIICKDGYGNGDGNGGNRNGDKKKLVNFNTITETIFLEEHSYLKNINYDDVIMDMDYKFEVDEFKSPIIDLCIFYAKMNEKHHMLETIYEFNDPPYPVLSNNEVLHDPFYY